MLRDNIIQNAIDKLLIPENSAGQLIELKNNHTFNKGSMFFVRALLSINKTEDGSDNVPLGIWNQCDNNHWLLEWQVTPSPNPSFPTSEYPLDYASKSCPGTASQVNLCPTQPARPAQPAQPDEPEPSAGPRPSREIITPCLEECRYIGTVQGNCECIKCCNVNECHKFQKDLLTFVDTGDTLDCKIYF